MSTGNGNKFDLKTIPGVDHVMAPTQETTEPLDARHSISNNNSGPADVVNDQQILEGFLKQQSIDSTGIYQWNRKFFRLFASKGVIEASEIDDLDASLSDHRHSYSRDVSASFSSMTGGLAIDTISLAGLRSAKEWTAMTSALGSCGFDLLWASGRIWSFLADDEMTCKQWVRAINHSLELIYSNVRGMSMSLDSLSAKRSPPISPPRAAVSAPAPLPPVPRVEAQGLVGETREVDGGKEVHSVIQSKSKATTILQASTTTDSIPVAADITVEFQSSPYRAGGASGPGNLVPHTEPRHGHVYSSRGVSVEEINREPLNTPPRNVTSAGTLQGFGDHSAAFMASPGMQSISQIPKVPSSVDGSSQNSDGSHGGLSGDDGDESLASRRHSNRAQELKHIHVLQPYPGLPGKDTGAMRSRVNTEESNGAISDSFDERIRGFQKAALVAEAEVESLREELAYMKQQTRDSMRAVAERHSAVRDQDRKTIQKLRSELDNLIMDSNSKDAKFTSEIKQLEEELNEERRSHKSAIERYDQEMKRSEAQRESMREKLSNLRSRCEELEAELHSMRSEGAKHGSRDIEAQCESLRKENRDLKSQIESIAVENAVKTNSAVSRAIDQLNASFAETAKQIEKAAQDSAKKLYESKKATELLAMQSNCNNQIETVKAELQAKAAKDLEEQRKTFEAREAQTMLDLQQLEGLHQHRVSELETLVRTLRARCETAEEALSAAAVSRVKMSVASRDITNERIKQLEAYAETAESLQAALHSKNEELLGVRSKEVSYMEQLRRVTEENSVLRAQNQATLRQAAQDASDAMESRRSKHDLELRVASMSSSLAIAREETFLLENEVNRLKALNSHLQDALDRADNVIYGNGVLSVNNHKKGTVLSFKSPAASLNQRSFGKTKITVAPSDHDMHQRHQHPEVSQASSSRREMTSPAPRSKAPSPAATQSTPQRRSRAAPK